MKQNSDSSFRGKLTSTTLSKILAYLSVPEQNPVELDRLVVGRPVHREPDVRGPGPARVQHDGEHVDVVDGHLVGKHLQELLLEALKLGLHRGLSVVVPDPEGRETIWVIDLIR